MVSDRRANVGWEEGGVKDNTESSVLASGTIPEIGGRHRRRRRRLEGHRDLEDMVNLRSHGPQAASSMNQKLRTQVKVKADPNNREMSTLFTTMEVFRIFPGSEWSEDH